MIQCKTAKTQENKKLTEIRLKLRWTVGERILFVSLLSGCLAISGFERHLGLADHPPRFHARALNPAG